MSMIKLLQEHAGGATQEEISDAIREVVAAVSDERRKGSVTITIGIEPLGKGDGLSVSFDVKSKPPVAKPRSATFFATPANDLQRQDPRQTDLPLRDIKPAPHSALA
jgi:hypothetical protein